MRVGYVNNFSQKLAFPLSAGDTEVQIDGGASSLILGARDATEESIVAILTITDGLDIEIVKVDEIVGENTLRIQRGFEGTVPRNWSPGALIEMRLTAAFLNMLATMKLPVVLGDRMMQADGNDRAVFIGSQIFGGGTNPIAIGFDLNFNGEEVIAMGRNCFASGDHSVAIGRGIQANGKTVVAIGDQVAAHEDDGCAIGRSSQASKKAIALGAESKVYSEYGVAVGCTAQSSSPFAIALGYGARVNPPGSMVLGCGLGPSIPGTYHAHALPAMPRTPQEAPPELAQMIKPVTRWATNLTAIQAPILDLAEHDAVASFDLPQGAVLFIDGLDFVVTASSGADGNPTIKIGVSDSEDDILLAATEVTETDLYARTTFTPAHSHGVTSVRIEVVNAASGTLKGKLIVRGYVMEV